ncbi:hypothetical protein SAMN05421505_13456 [Sinosporangium album]|uniref:ThiS family protein n=1 Tax=Sinosporangium album TaxID=504805 RepID=A0A1G8HYG0_9ACTN|nr:hypothetical protein [Sinosporangium album]SDI11673.1 hypothetical protein SAMN05421505_13456 [Sinosporangium album]
MKVILRGYPEAASGLAEVDVPLTGTVLPATLVAAVEEAMGRDGPSIHRVLWRRPDGGLRATTRILQDGTPIEHGGTLNTYRPATLLAVLPCDG